MLTGDKLIEVKDLKKYYNDGAVKALDGVILDIYKGDVVVFMDAGHIVEQGTPTEVFEHPQSPRLQDFLSKVL